MARLVLGTVGSALGAESNFSAAELLEDVTPLPNADGTLTMHEAMVRPLRDYRLDRDGARPSPAICRAMIAAIQRSVTALEAEREGAPARLAAAEAAANDHNAREYAADGELLALLLDGLHERDVYGNKVPDWKPPRMVDFSGNQWLVRESMALRDHVTWRRWNVLRTQGVAVRGEATRAAMRIDELGRALGPLYGRMAEIEAVLAWWQRQADELGVDVDSMTRGI